MFLRCESSIGFRSRWDLCSPEEWFRMVLSKRWYGDICVENDPWVRTFCLWLDLQSWRSLFYSNTTASIGLFLIRYQFFLESFFRWEVLALVVSFDELGRTELMAATLLQNFVGTIWEESPFLRQRYKDSGSIEVLIMLKSGIDVAVF